MNDIIGSLTIYIPLNMPHPVHGDIERRKSIAQMHALTHDEARARLAHFAGKNPRLVALGLHGEWQPASVHITL